MEPAHILPGCRDIHHHVQSQKELSEQGATPPSPGELSKAHTEIPADVRAPPRSLHWLAFASGAGSTSSGQRLVRAPTPQLDFQPSRALHLPQTSVSHRAVISQVFIRFGLQRICSGRGCLQGRVLQSLSSRGISACPMGTSGMHQHTPGTFSSGHAPERKKQRKNKHSAGVAKLGIHPDCVKSRFA